MTMTHPARTEQTSEKLNIARRPRTRPTAGVTHDACVAFPLLSHAHAEPLTHGDHFDAGAEYARVKTEARGHGFDYVMIAAAVRGRLVADAVEGRVRLAQRPSEETPSHPQRPIIGGSDAVGYDAAEPTVEIKPGVALGWLAE